MAKIGAFFRGIGGGLKKGLFAVGHFIKKHKVLSLVLAVVLCAGGFFGVRAVRGSSAAAAAAYSFIRTTTLVRGSLDSTVSSTGTVQSSDTSTVSYSAAGGGSTALKIKTVNVAVGDSVQAGDVIVTLDASDILKSITEEKEKLADALADAQEAYDDAVADYDSAVDDSEAQETVLDNAKAALSAAAKRYDSAKAAVASFQTAYDTAYAAAEAAGKAMNSAGGIAASDAADSDEQLNAAVAQAETVLAEKQAAQAAAQSARDAAQAAAAAAPEDAALAGEAAAAESALAAAKAETDGAQAALDGAKRAVLVRSYTNADNALKTAEANLKNAKAACNYDTYESEYAKADAAVQTARTALDSREKTVSTCEDAVERARDTLENASTSDTLETLNEQLEACSLTAETSGKVTSLTASVGSTPSGTIATIQDTDSLKIAITIAEADINTVAVGMPCSITSDATDGTIAGTLTQIDPIAGQSGTFGAEVTVNTADSGLLVGMNATVEILLSSTADCFMVPIDAVGTDAAGSFVYRQTGGSGTDMTFETVYVTTGDSNDYYVEISADTLAEGDVIRSSCDLTQGVEETTDTAGLDASMLMGGNRGAMAGGAMTGGSANATRGERPSGDGAPAGMGG